MKLPRDVSGAQLVKLLASLGYRVTRQSGSHIRLAAILSEVATQQGLSREQLVEKLFGR